MANRKWTAITKEAALEVLAAVGGWPYGHIEGPPPIPGVLPYGPISAEDTSIVATTMASLPDTDPIRMFWKSIKPYSRRADAWSLNHHLPEPKDPDPDFHQEWTSARPSHNAYHLEQIIQQWKMLLWRAAGVDVQVDRNSPSRY